MTSNKREFQRIVRRIPMNNDVKVYKNFPVWKIKNDLTETVICVICGGTCVR